MIKKDQNSFYKYLGHQLTEARRSSKISIAQLSTLSGEQHKTITDIEHGKYRCSLHHAVWMCSLLGMDLNEIIRNFTEGKYEHITDDFQDRTSTAIELDDLI